MSELGVKRRRVRAEVNVEEAVGLLCRIVVEALQGLHGVGRADLLEDGLQLLVGAQAANAVELRLRSDHRGDGGKLLRADPAGDVLVAASCDQRVKHVFALGVEHGRIITEIVYNDQNIEEAFISLFLLESYGQLVLILYNHLQRLVVELVEEALLAVPHAEFVAHVVLDRPPYGINIDAR